MYQFHGWISLRDAINKEIRLGETLFEENLLWLRKVLAEEEILKSKIELLTFDDRYLLALHAHVNRRRVEADRMAELVQQVASRFESSKGLVFEFDGQARMSGGSGVYTVTVVENGRAYHRQDPFLSPVELQSN